MQRCVNERQRSSTPVDTRTKVPCGNNEWLLEVEGRDYSVFVIQLTTRASDATTS